MYFPDAYFFPELHWLLTSRPEEPAMRVICVDELHAILRAQGVPREHLAFVCPACATVQSMASLVAAGAGKTPEDVEKFVSFSCVGRWTNAGPAWQGKKRRTGGGCDWTLGGFLPIHKLEVVTPDEKRHPTFEPATPAQAKALMEALAR